MTAPELVSYLNEQGFTLTLSPGEKLEVQPASKLTDTLRALISTHKPALLKVLADAAEQPFRGPADKTDADYWTQRCNTVLDQWKRKDWGPCHRCGQTAWYEHMGFSLCGICVPRTPTAGQAGEGATAGKTTG
ncbi:MAG TPA: hypothetical protein VKJ47_17920 [Candidatus Binatia bacterium]|nr:hypothetical protein [Candidatus Binatia bacterium]